MKNRFILFALSCLFPITFMSSCNKQGLKEELHDCSVHRDEEFGGAYIDISIADFNSLGFEFGDSVKLTFNTNGQIVTYEDIGYYSGYYVPAGQELLVGYKGYDYIKFCVNYGEDVYLKHNFNENTLVTIQVQFKERYLAVEETLSISYEDDRSKYESDEQFANFREIKVGRIKEKTLYRGASPVDDSRKRSEIVDSLLEKNNIQFNIDLADKEESITTQSKYKVHSYMQSLMDQDKCVFLGMAAAYKEEDFATRLKTLFLTILNNDGPYYIHCLEGKDRTGYVCMVIEALCGATYDDLIDDYFVTYHNYYGIEKDSYKYEVIKEMHIDEMIRYVFGFDKGEYLLGASYHSKARAYLEYIGLTTEQIDQLQEKLSNE